MGDKIMWSGNVLLNGSYFARGDPKLTQLRERDHEGYVLIMIRFRSTDRGFPSVINSR